jgi:hypothetical protein
MALSLRSRPPEIDLFMWFLSSVDLHATYGKLGLCYAVYPTVFLVLAATSHKVVNGVGTRIASLIGMVLFVIGWGVASFAQQWWHLGLAVGLGAGTGTALLLAATRDAAAVVPPLCVKVAFSLSYHT